MRDLVKNQYPGQIRCIVRSTSDASELDGCPLKIDKRIGDLRDQEFLNRTLQGVETVLHIGSIFYSVNLVKAALANHVKRAILVHTTGIYSKHKSASAEYQTIESDIKTLSEKDPCKMGIVYLRPTMIFGRLQDKNISVFIRMIDKLRIFPVVGGGRSLIQPVNGRDLGKAYYQLLTKPEIMTGDYILSGEKPLATSGVFQMISGLLGKQTTFLSVPLTLSVLVARTIKSLTLGKIDLVEKVQRMGEDRSFSHDAAFRDFGYAPMPFAEGLRIEVEEYIRAKAARP